MYLLTELTSALENGSGSSGLNNPFSVMPGLAGLMGMGGMGCLNNSQITNMWGGMGGPRNMPPMGFNRGMMEQVNCLTVSVKNTLTNSLTVRATFQLGLSPPAPFNRAREQVLSSFWLNLPSLPPSQPPSSSSDRPRQYSITISS